MKITDIITHQLAARGLKKPSVELLEQLEEMVTPKVEELILSSLTPRQIAKAFASTLTPAKVKSKGLLRVAETTLNQAEECPPGHSL